MNSNNDLTIALKQMFNFDRYGYVETDKNGRITLFNEKQYQESGKIDGGIYIIRKDLFQIIEKDSFLFGEFIKTHLVLGEIAFSKDSGESINFSFSGQFTIIGFPSDILTISG